MKTEAAKGEVKKEKKVLRDLTEISMDREKPVEKALRLGSDEVIARAISDMIKRDGF